MSGPGRIASTIDWQLTTPTVVNNMNKPMSFLNATGMTGIYGVAARIGKIDYR